MAADAVAQSVQQLWFSSRSRTTRRDSVGLSRLILARTAAYASSGSLLAKNGCTGTAAVDAWQRAQYLRSMPGGFAGSFHRRLAWNFAESTGKLLLAPTSLMVGSLSSICLPPVADAPAQLRIETVIGSAQAEAAASQQLWPPPTFCPRRD